MAYKLIDPSVSDLIQTVKNLGLHAESQITKAFAAIDQWPKGEVETSAGLKIRWEWENGFLTVYVSMNESSLSMSKSECNAINELLSKTSPDTWSQMNSRELEEFGRTMKVEDAGKFSLKCLTLGIGEIHESDSV